MGNKMLIDAAHPEETRVVVLRGNRIEEFDFEAASKRQLRGNIYLAKVTRVEPSLQAAFIEYGGNRHGFLAFSEIHPDYYQIPVADRQQLLEDEARSAEDEEDEPRPGNGRRSRRHRRGGNAEKRASGTDESVRSDEVAATEEPAGELPIEAGFESAEAVTDEAEARVEVADGEASEARQAASEPDHDDAGVEPDDHGPEPMATAAGDDETPPAVAASSDDDPEGDVDHVTTLEHGLEAPLSPASPDEALEAETGAESGHDNNGDAGSEDEVVEQLGGDALEDVPHRSSRPRRHYKIQEVIKRRQVLLVQVVKEERGNKGAALTTYLSLAGRYSVLMPNTARGGGISRKIADPEDRKRLKAIAQELEVPDGMGIILRTAGASRGLPEVKRDFEYLMRMWETVRETTLKSSAPTLVYEEGSLIKRSIRDLFTKDVDEVVVSGEEGYSEAKEFMRLLMPNQLRNVIPYRDPQPLFAKSGVEAQLDAMFSNQVVLKSGGYLVINQTEALVAIDVNSGRSTREHNIEDTALRTNLEAADEIARQLRLRDLAGLIVVDFIDMEEGRNDRAVERRIKDALKNDRARIQIGRISHFGLLEMSRQRMRTGVLEGSTVMCAHCAGSGTVRSVSSMALHVLRLLEDSLIRSAAYNLIARTRTEVALYILNQKRANLLGLESRFGVAITVLADPAMTGMVYHAIERGAEATPPQVLTFRADLPPADTTLDEDESVDELEAADIEADVASDDDEVETEGASHRGSRAEGQRDASPEGEGDAGRRRRRRRRRRGGRDGQPNGLRAETSEQDGGEMPMEGGADAETGSDVEALTDMEAGFLPEAAEPSADDPAALTSEAPLTEALPSERVTPEAQTIGTPMSEAPAPEMPAASEPLDAAPAEEKVEEPVAAAPMESDAADADAAEAPRRRRTRRPARGAAAAEPAAAPADGAVGEEPAAPARRARRGRARAADLPLDLDETGPSADRDIEAEVARPAPATPREPELPLSGGPGAPQPSDPVPEPASASTAEPAKAEPAPTEAAAAEPDPDRPKRSGWWQRAKATFSAGS